MKLKQISIGTLKECEFQKSFNSEMWCTSEMFWRILNRSKINTEGIRKIAIVLGDEKSVNKFGPVFQINQKIDFESYFAMNSFDRKKFILDLLHANLLDYSNQIGIDKDALIDTYNECLNKRILNRWLLKDKFVRSPNHQFYGGIECIWELDKFVAFGVIFNKDKQEVFRKPLVEKEPYFGDFIYLAKSGWVEDSFFLQSNGGEKWAFQFDPSMSKI